MTRAARLSWAEAADLGIDTSKRDRKPKYKAKAAMVLFGRVFAATTREQVCLDLKALRYSDEQIAQGRWFASKKEATHYVYLLDCQRRGEISDLKCQTRWPLELKGLLIATYVDDFNYRDRQGQLVVEDTKGMWDAGSPATQLFKIKARLMLALHKIDVRVIR